MIELLFLLGFTLHNLEEAVWLPAWSKYAGKFHREVKRNEFHFAVLVVTVIGYLITFIHLVSKNIVVQYAFYGFVLMMCLNVLFPHLAATFIFKRYAPGLLTGLFLNIPFGIFLIQDGLSNGISPIYLLVSTVIVSAIIIPSLEVLFKIGGKMIESY